MREIKFRAWYPQVKKMIHFENPIVGCDCQEKWAMMIYPREGHVFMGKAEVMQFTGLRDKNGKEIYEGDVVRVLVEETFNTSEQTGLIVWVNDIHAHYGIEFDSACLAVGDERLGLPNEDFEVIGNIYENQGLLK